MADISDAALEGHSFLIYYFSSFSVLEALNIISNAENSKTRTQSSKASLEKDQLESIIKNMVLILRDILTINQYLKGIVI